MLHNTPTHYQTAYFRAGIFHASGFFIIKPFRSFLACSLILILTQIRHTGANPDAKMLYNDLLRKSGYNKLIRPVMNNTDILTVKVGLKLSQLIDIVSSIFLLTY